MDSLLRAPRVRRCSSVPRRKHHEAASSGDPWRPELVASELGLERVDDALVQVPGREFRQSEPEEDSERHAPPAGHEQAGLALLVMESAQRDDVVGSVNAAAPAVLDVMLL